MLLVELLHSSVFQQISLYAYVRGSGDVHVVDIWNAVQYGLRGAL